MNRRAVRGASEDDGWARAARAGGAATSQPEVPDCVFWETQDQGFAEWDAESGIIWVHDQGNYIGIYPDEVRKLYAWVEEHKLT